MPATEQLLSRLRSAISAVDREAGAAQQLALAGQRAVAEAEELRGLIDQHQRVTTLLTTIGEQAQEHAQREIEQLVTRGLQVIFGEELTFHLIPSVKANRAELDFVIRSHYGERVIDTPVLEARGGGMVVVVAFMLRLVVLLLTPGARRVLVLDESFAHVSAGFEARVAEFLREVCQRAGVQIIMVTHSDAYADFADVRYQLRLGAGGVTKAERV